MRRHITQMTLTGVACAFVLVASIASLHADEIDSPAKKVLRKLLTAVEQADYDSFVEDGSAAFKAGITKQMFEGVCAQLSSRMKKGYETYYLGQLKQQGCQVHLWKLVYKVGGDDTLAKLVLQDGKVAGFWLQ